MVFMCFYLSKQHHCNRVQQGLGFCYQLVFVAYELLVLA